MIYALIYWEAAVHFSSKTCLCRWYLVTQALPHSGSLYAHFSLFFWSSAKSHSKMYSQIQNDCQNLSALLGLIRYYLEIQFSWLFLTHLSDVILLVSRVYCKDTLLVTNKGLFWNFGSLWIVASAKCKTSFWFWPGCGFPGIGRNTGSVCPLSTDTTVIFNRVDKDRGHKSHG